MLTIGLTGGSGSGKSSVSELIALYGIPSINADKLYHELTRAGCELTLLLSEHFGKSVIGDDGTLNRRALADIVFSDLTGELLSKLNSLTHGAVINQALKLIDIERRKGTRAIIFDAPLLFESGFDKKCDYIISVIADENLRLQRIIKRDGITMDAAKKRISSQKNDEFLISHSDFIIRNNGDFTELHDQIDEMIKKIFR